MVRTDKPKASATPTKPIPSSGKAAESTALPHPANTSQKVPTNSAAARRFRFICNLRPERNRARLLLIPRGWRHLAHKSELLRRLVRSQLAINTGRLCINLDGSQLRDVLHVLLPLLVRRCKN